MANLSLKGIEKIYPGNKTKSVENFNLEIENEEFIVLIGPSGCGKSTLLRMIAGLEEITSGELYIDGKLMNDVEPKDRDIAMVFQNYALYPHMTVYDNMAFALKLRNIDKDTIDKEVRRAAKVLNIEEYLERKPKALSGGQRQRVALGRAIVRKPKVFLMDEPLSNLDAKLRVQTRAEIIKMHEDLKTTFIYVTHDQTEAMTMGDRIVIMHDGIVQQVDTPQNLYNEPANIFVAGFIGSPQMNFINGKVIEKEGKFRFVNEDLYCDLLEKDIEIIKKNNMIGEDIVMGIRPEHIDIDYSENSPYSIPLKLEIIELLGSEGYLHFKTSSDQIVAKVNLEEKGIEKGDKKVLFELDKLYFFNPETTNRLV
ncbi:MAG: sn-glycerol-3-phosphate ABC transporter ATP-binding protein UgpC [Andreesenia angusta]|nr:sn-glycerol-3-phosphate ABC transporter ATP-binding protein UgpC [Andreesenia angusta]